MTNNSFTTKLQGNNIDVWDMKHLCKFIKREHSYKDNYEISAVANITWDFYAEMRSWGVKDVGAYATKVAVEMEVSVWGDDEDEVVAVVEIDTDKDDWEIETDMDNCDREQYCPTDITINFENKTFYVNF